MSALVLQTSQAAYVLLENLEGVGSAFTGDGSIVVDPVDVGNNVWSVPNNNGRSFLDIPDIANMETATLFMRIRVENAQNLSFGVTDVANPTTWQHYEGYGRFTVDAIDVRDAGTFSQVGAAANNQWYNIWLVLNNATDQTTLYFNDVVGGDALE